MALRQKFVKRFKGNSKRQGVAAEISKDSFEAMTQLMDSQLAYKEQESGRFHFAQSKWQELPFKDESFDLAEGDLILNIVFKEEKAKETSLQEHIQEQQKVLTELRRILKSEGKAVLRTWVLPENLEKNGSYRDIQNIFDEWDAHKRYQGKKQLDPNNLDDRKFIFKFFGNRLIRHYQDETGKFICSDMAELIGQNLDRDGQSVKFPDGVEQVMSWYWETYKIPNWILPQKDQEKIFQEAGFKIAKVIATDDDLSAMNPIYVLSKNTYFNNH
jgi:SAM-dependent methyltransferase